MSTTGRRTATALAVVVLLTVVVAVLVHSLTGPAATVVPAQPSASSTTDASPPSSSPSSTVISAPTPPAPTVTPTSATRVPSSDVTVTTTFAGVDPASGAVMIGAYVDVVESGGVCTLTLTSSNGVPASVSGSATPDASTTSCGTLALPSTSVSPGTWQAVVGYSSTSHQGVSAPVTVTVP